MATGPTLLHHAHAAGLLPPDTHLTVYRETTADGETLHHTHRCPTRELATTDTTTGAAVDAAGDWHECAYRPRTCPPVRTLPPDARTRLVWLTGPTTAAPTVADVAALRSHLIGYPAPTPDTSSALAGLLTGHHTRALAADTAAVADPHYRQDLLTHLLDGYATLRHVTDQTPLLPPLVLTGWRELRDDTHLAALADTHQRQSGGDTTHLLTALTRHQVWVRVDPSSALDTPGPTALGAADRVTGPDRDIARIPTVAWRPWSGLTVLAAGHHPPQVVLDAVTLTDDAGVPALADAIAATTA